MSLEVEPLAIPEVVLVRTKRHQDERGSLTEVLRDSELARLGLPRFVQCNFTRSRRGVLRGLHFQRSPHAQAKLVRCTHGQIFDVAVDVRPGSKTFAQWVGVELSGADDTMLFVPEGFAHGFCVTSEEAHVVYFMSREYDPSSDRVIRWDDPQLEISWPVKHPELSQRDAAAPLLSAI